MTTTLTETMAQYRNLLLNEKWDSKMHTAPKDKGKFKGKSKSEIGSGLAKNKKTAENDRKAGKKEPASLKKNIKQKEFALRAKNNFGKVSEGFLRESPHPKMEAILQKYGYDVDQFIESNFDLYTTSAEFQHALYEYYSPDMPYGTAKARTGDPDEWITEHFSKYLEDNGLLPEEAPIPVDDDFSNENLGPNWGRDGASNGRPLGEEYTKYSDEFYADVSEKEKPMEEFLRKHGWRSHVITAPNGRKQLMWAKDGSGTESSTLNAYHEAQAGITEGKTNRKCKGKGCDKKCPDGKNYCSKKCESSKKAVKESKFTPGPFSKSGSIKEEAEDKKIKCTACNKETKVGYDKLSGKKGVQCRDCWKKEKDSVKKKK